MATHVRTHAHTHSLTHSLTPSLPHSFTHARRRVRPPAAAETETKRLWRTFGRMAGEHLWRRYPTTIIPPDVFHQINYSVRSS